MAQRYPLHPGQYDVFRSRARFRYVVCGRGWGKTHVAIACILEAVTSPGVGDGFEAYYIARTHKSARKTVWKRLKRAIPKEWIRGKPHETNLEITLKNGATITLMGSDALDSIRGQDINFCVIDEFAFCKPDTWHVIRPCLRRPSDRAIIITTPNGPNHAFELWNKVKGQRSWAAFTKPTWDNPFHDREGVNEDREVMPRTLFEQEYGASFAALKGAVYCDFSPDRNVLLMPQKVDLTREIFVGQDYNGGNYSAVIGQVHGDELYILDELVTPTTIHDHAAALIGWFEDRGIRDWRERVTVFADTSGEYNKTTGLTADNRIMRKAGFRTKGDPQNPPVLNRVYAVQALIYNGAERVRLHLNPSCKQLQHCMLNQVWNAWGKPDKAAGLDHLPDALGYMVHGLFPLRVGRTRSRAA